MAIKYYIDCEFDGHGGPLLSIAMVPEVGERSIHIRTTEAARDPWVQANVEPFMFEHKAQISHWVSVNEVGPSIRAFLGDIECFTIVADSPVDIGRFCAALSTGSNGGWASTGYEQMTFEVHNVACYPTTLEDAVRHNAWWDAMALREMMRARA